MADYWIKLYHEILDDPKMATMPDNLWRRTTELFLLAGRLYKDGMLPDTKQIAWALRMDENVLETELQQIVTSGIIQKVEGGWFIPNFVKRQRASTNTERSAAYRERKQKQQYYGNATDAQRNVAQITDNRSDTDQITDTDNKPPQIFIDGDLLEYQQVFEKDTGIASYRIDQAFEVWSKMKADGVTPQDMHKGTQEMLHSDRNYSIVRPQSVLNAAYTAKQNRIYKEENDPPKPTGHCVVDENGKQQVVYA